MHFILPDALVNIYKKQMHGKSSVVMPHTVLTPAEVSSISVFCAIHQFTIHLNRRKNYVPIRRLYASVYIRAHENKCTLFMNTNADTLLRTTPHVFFLCESVKSNTGGQIYGY